MTARTLADPMFASIFNTAVVEPYDADAVRQALINHGEKIMNATQAQITCETTEEHSHPTTPSTTIPSSLGQAVPIVGVSGNTYAPMDTSPATQSNQQLTHLFKQLEDIITAIIQLSATRQQTNAQTDLEEAVSTALEQAQWFKDRIEENCADAIENHDFDYEIGQNVEGYMRNHFDPNDHVDFEALVKDRVEDEIESIIDGLVEEAVEARLADLLEEKLANANITINF